jgi:ketosteroid isomerase-like protein
MAAAEVEIVRAYLDALTRGDRDVARGYLDPNVVLDMSGSDVPERGIYEGVSGIERFAASWNEVWESYYQEVKHLISVGDGVVLSLAHEHGRSASGIEVHGQEIAGAFTVRAEKIVRVYEYPSWRAALDAFGLADVP